MSTSGSVSFNLTRDDIIAAALRNCNAIGEGQTPNTTQVTEVAQRLNMVLAALQADGMPLWETTEYEIAYVLDQRQYTIGLGGSYDLTAIPPLKVYQAWNRSDSGVSTQVDSPNLLVTRLDYNMLGSKLNEGPPNQIFYDPPRAIQSSTQPYGTVTVFPVPDTNAVADLTLVVVGQKMAELPSSSSDTLDFPAHWSQAVVWLLTEEIAPSQGVGLAERSMIEKKAQRYKDYALSFGTEEGSLMIQPTATR